MAIEKCSKSAPKYKCDFCDYSTSKTSSYVRHIATPKHIRTTNEAKETIKTCPKAPPKFSCECGNAYIHNSSLWKHRKTCTFQQEKKQEVPTTDTLNNNISNEILLEFMKKDSEFKALLMEAFKNGIGNTTHTNSHNTTTKNKFNLNFFLNEKCKDAMNIMDFVNTMQLQLSDLERVGEHGYVKGISHIVVNKLKDLDITKRPIHCSDLKRETMYVKDEDAWEKDETKRKLSKMLTHVAHKNQKQIPVWQEENPEYKDSESVKSEKYLKIIGESMSGLTNDDDSSCYTNQIIKNIAKEVVIEKEE